MLARSLKEIGPRLAYALRTHEIPFHAPLAPQLHPSADALLVAARARRRVSAGSRRTTTPRSASLASPLFGADPLELRRFAANRATLYGALRDSGDFDAVLRGAGDRQAAANRGRGRSTRSGSGSTTSARSSSSGRDARARSRSSPRVTALSDAANEFDGAPAEFPAAFREGELDDGRLAARPRRRRLTPSRS